jgi:hypothetical protein
MTRLVGFQAADDFNDSTDKMPVGRVNGKPNFQPLAVASPRRRHNWKP